MPPLLRVTVIVSAPARNVPSAVSVIPGISVVFVPPAAIVPVLMIVVLPSNGSNCSVRLPRPSSVIVYVPACFLSGVPLALARLPVPATNAADTSTAANSCVTALRSVSIAVFNAVVSSNSRFVDPTSAPTAPKLNPTSLPLVYCVVSPSASPVTTDRKDCPSRRIPESVDSVPLTPSGFTRVRSVMNPCTELYCSTNFDNRVQDRLIVRAHRHRRGVPRRRLQQRQRHPRQRVADRVRARVLCRAGVDLVGRVLP